MFTPLPPRSLLWASTRAVESIGKKRWNHNLSSPPPERSYGIATGGGGAFDRLREVISSGKGNIKVMDTEDSTVTTTVEFLFKLEDDIVYIDSKIANIAGIVATFFNNLNDWLEEASDAKWKDTPEHHFCALLSFRKRMAEALPFVDVFNDYTRDCAQKTRETCDAIEKEIQISNEENQINDNSTAPLNIEAIPKGK
jgi:hypothetical protein